MILHLHHPSKINFPQRKLSSKLENFLLFPLTHLSRIRKPCHVHKHFPDAFEKN